jgi:hypothetical protein
MTQELSALTVFAAGAIVSSAAFACPSDTMFIPHQAPNGSGICLNLVTQDRFRCVAHPVQGPGGCPANFRIQGAPFVRPGDLVIKEFVNCCPLTSDPPPPDWVDMLQVHNERRELHCAPGLTWSRQLAQEAQDWANACTNTHSSEAFTSYGESLAFAFPPGQSDRFAFENTWYCEIKWYDFDHPELVGGLKKGCDPPVNGHFTQAVWGATRYLGCGRQNCKIDGQQGTYWVCRYKLAGNNRNVLTENVHRPTCGVGTQGAVTTTSPAGPTPGPGHTCPAGEIPCGSGCGRPSDPECRIE